jgi:hypothetical protein
MFANPNQQLPAIGNAAYLTRFHFKSKSENESFHDGFHFLSYILNVPFFVDISDHGSASSA